MREQSSLKRAGKPPSEGSVATACMLLSLVLVPLGFLFIANAIPAAVKRLRAAVNPYEKRYWGLNVAGHLLIASGAAVLLLLIIDGLRGEPGDIARAWPSLSHTWYGSGNRMILLLLDLLLVFACGLCLLCVARVYGDVDEDNVWRAPDWLMRHQLLQSDLAKERQVSRSEQTAGIGQSRENT